MAATPYGPPPGFEPHWGHIDEAPHKAPAVVADFEPVPDPPQIPTDPASRQAVFLGWAASALPLLIYNLAEAFDWVHFTGDQLAALKAIYGAVWFAVTYWTASNVYSKASVAKIRAGKDVA